MRRLVVLSILSPILFAAWPSPAAAQANDYPFQLGVHFAGVSPGEFKDADLGAGARLSWHPTTLVGTDAEMTFYPSDYGDPAFTGSRVEALFGATIGPRIGPLRVFARVRPGFVRFGEAPEPIACIAIFPPPLACTLADGRTLFALDVGGGIEWLPAGRTFIRVDAGDRAVRYPGPVIDGDGSAREDAFFGHDLRFAVGGGVRF